MVYRQTERSRKVRAARRNKILRSARKLFLQRGYDVTTMRSVAEAAGTSIGNLYFYFQDKEALLETLLAETREPTWARADAAAGTVPAGPARLAILMYANTLALLGPHRDLTSAMLLRGSPPEVAERVLEAYRVRLREYFRENLPGLPDQKRELAVTAWTGAGRSLLERRIRGELDIEPAALAEYAVRWNLQGAGFSPSAVEQAVQTAITILGTEFDDPEP